MPRLTILICTHNRASLLARVLSSLDRAHQPVNWDVDVLVAANACSDNTHAMLERRRAEPDEKTVRLPLGWFAEPTPGKSHALNSAMPRIAADVVAFVDDDHRVHEDYLKAVCAGVDTYPEADLFCGRILPDWDGQEPAWVHDQGKYRIYPLPVPRFDQGDTPRSLTPDVAVPGGGNLFLRTPLLARVGPFATDMGPCGHDLGGSEDADWVLRAIRLGAKLQYVPDMIQYHYVDLSRLTLSYLMRKAYKRTASTVGLHGAPAGNGVPLYLYRKLASYISSAVTALNPAKRRFFLVRSAAALGEITGYRRLRARATPHSTTSAQPDDHHA